jgi:hypothetical protein
MPSFASPIFIYWIGGKMTDQSTIGKGMIAFRLPPDLAGKLDRLAVTTDRSRSAVLRELLRRAAVEQPDLALSDEQGVRT